MRCSALAGGGLVALGLLTTPGVLRAQFIPDTAYRPFPRTWVGALESDDPAFCLFLYDGGRTRLVARQRNTTHAYQWAYDSTNGNLLLTLLDPDSGEVALWKDAVGVAIISFDTTSSTALQVVLSHDGIWFGGWNLAPISSVDSTNYLFAQRACRLPPWSERARLLRAAPW